MSAICEQINGLLAPVAGTYGFVAWHPSSGEKIDINEHEALKSASVIKVPLMVELFCLRDEGKLSLDEKVVVHDGIKVAGSGVLRELHDGAELTLRDLIALMIVVSDNTATNMLIDRIGLDSVSERMRTLGLTNTVLARKMYDWDAANAGRENRCTAYDLALLMKTMAEGRISSKSTSTEMVEIMARQQYREKIPLLLPEDTKVANKTGSLTGVTNDVGIVYGPTGPYVIAVLTKDVPSVVAADRAIAEASRLIYGHFCP